MGLPALQICWPVCCTIQELYRTEEGLALSKTASRRWSTGSRQGKKMIACQIGQCSAEQYLREGKHCKVTEIATAKSLQIQKEFAISSYSQFAISLQHMNIVKAHRCTNSQPSSKIVSIMVGQKHVHCVVKPKDTEYLLLQQ